jgi:soluble lytic murein transglycosylase
MIFALQRLARTSPQDAAARLRPLAAEFEQDDREFLWGRLGYYGALFHDPEALAWFARAGRLDDNQLEWKARAALRAQNWTELLEAVQAMSEGVQSEPEWRYWKARALKEQGNAAEANALLAPLSTGHEFYGLLATEELGEVIGPPVESYRPAEDEIAAVAALPAIRRALALYGLNLRFEGNREWLWAIGDFDDRQLLAAAEHARRNQLWDRAINTAERTRSLHDFGLRYLAPYREELRAHALEYGLDEAWVYGVVRQESRFVADARSSAGAMGLMQLMPATARWVAGKLGMKGFRQTAVTDLDINISLGTYYLRHVLDTLDNHPVLASAGYNAGPGRARAWRPDSPMEGAIYSETIPFDETRDYVKKVMANASHYARILGRGVVSLKQRLGIIPPRTDR